MDDIFNQLLGDVPIPKFIKVKQNFPSSKVGSIEEEIYEELINKNLISRIKPGQRIAITAGSRGITDISSVIKEVVKNIIQAGGIPFIVPCMGSHGGATAEGQLGILKDLGITEEFCGAPIFSSMEVVEVGKTNTGLSVCIDKYANEADGIVVINRIKPHTNFRGDYESGIAKMLAIGLGKQKGASICHGLGYGQMTKNIYDIAKVIIEKKNIVFAIGILENAKEETYKLIGMEKQDILNLEPKLQQESKDILAKIYFDKFDILILDEIGKNIGGTGMDTNIVGRYPTPYASGGPDITKLVVLDLTKESHGNANGIGLADFTTNRLFKKMEFAQTYPNSITSTVQTTIKIPMVLETDKLAIQGAIKTSNIENFKDVKIVRIKNTLELENIYISEGLLELAKTNPNLEILSETEELIFDDEGNIL